uniref:Uncharacterized protein n=1 Tax=Morchella importuna TaxID=1174673 RepID=A0A650AF82_9PEZI|nr:hypothetical protein [Morchella importuna]QGN66680.1 hypothetical protein [Morchella importuna]
MGSLNFSLPPPPFGLPPPLPPHPHSTLLCGWDLRASACAARADAVRSAEPWLRFFPTIRSMETTGPPAPPFRLIPIPGWSSESWDSSVPTHLLCGQNTPWLSVNSLVFSLRHWSLTLFTTLPTRLRYFSINGILEKSNYTSYRINFCYIRYIILEGPAGEAAQLVLILKACLPRS